MATETTAPATPSALPAGSKRYLRCKVCGFVIEEGKLGDLCPACGVKRSMFAADTERLSDRRRAILDLHIHPIIVHIPQAFAFSAFVLAVALPFVPGSLLMHTWCTLQVLAFFLPIAAIAGFLSGLYDGKVRFKKVATPYLIRKIIIGSVFIVDSATLAFSALTRKAPLDMPGFALVITGCLIAFICTLALGKIGAMLACSRMPG